MHRQHAAQRQQVIQDREDRFLVLTGVTRAADQDFTRREVHRDGHIRSRAVTRRIRLERRRRHHGELRLEAGEVRRRRHDEQIADEQVLPRELMDEANRQAIFRIGARVEVLHEELLALQVVDDVAPEDVEVRKLDWLVDLAPPDLRFARGFLHHELVVRRAAGMRAGPADERPLLREQAFLPANGMLVERSRGQVEMDGFRALHPVCFESLSHLGRTHKNMTPNSAG